VRIDEIECRHYAATCRLHLKQPQHTMTGSNIDASTGTLDDQTGLLCVLDVDGPGLPDTQVF
jgi:hypothetical protein